MWQVRPSAIANGGLGVFAVKHIKRGTWLTEYGGEIIDVEEALLRRRRGDDTHIRSYGIKTIYMCAAGMNPTFCAHDFPCGKNS